MSTRSSPKPLVLVVDDDASMRRALGRLLRSAGFEVETFSAATDFLKRRRPERPACLVLDVLMPGLTGLDLQKELAAADLEVPIVFITGHGDIPMSVQAMKAGAVDFLQKPFDDQELLDALERAIDQSIQTGEHRAVVEELQQRVTLLTPREREIFSLVVTGRLNKQIAGELGTSEKTVKVHRARVMKKMQADSLPGLVRMAEKVGLSAMS